MCGRSDPCRFHSRNSSISHVSAPPMPRVSTIWRTLSLLPDPEGMAIDLSTARKDSDHVGANGVLNDLLEGLLEVSTENIRPAIKVEGIRLLARDTGCQEDNSSVG